jgi:hypothetical protein
MPPENIEVGKCYLMKTGHVRRVLRLMPDERVQYIYRFGHLLPKVWRVGAQNGSSFKAMIKREVPCDWTPEAE